MNDAMRAYTKWADIGDAKRSREFQAYVKNIADARYVTRRVLRIVDDQAKHHGLEPLLHQALLQVYGSNEARGITVSTLAARLDVAAAFASRMVRRLEEMGLVTREASESDRRATNVVATEAGAQKLAEIDDEVHHNVAFLQHQLREDERLSALSIFAFYVGLDPDSAIAEAIRAAAES
ncbi:MarR family winged helix-turn-helix transcriptional regulator [Amycolatopsis sp. FDAARGOS 1241]|uniref:MarR family winged helix-turn-helix transcriptional regulator n=1 Tax=Amycolatopsis sp. FDAARGOS 1241 TaxID=2778070 RepID=UPI00194E7BF7|nr:MarR family transcriptional regulator [Amycolatopsis sp. FDAARGOS 1241]QRP43459.1 MarR family transcriptional regulator [Amycolatopsis sp. FDAARGOS 1241]